MMIGAATANAIPRPSPMELQKAAFNFAVAPNAAEPDFAAKYATTEEPPLVATGIENPIIPATEAMRASASGDLFSRIN